MSKLSFFPMGDRPHIFEIYDGATSIGLAWKQGDVWCADPIKMGQPKVTGETLEEVARKLARFLGEPI